MPNHKQYKKSLRQDAKRHLRNKAMKSNLATAVKKVRQSTSREEGEKHLQNAVSVIDRVARKGVIKKETAARKKSRLHTFVHTLS